MAHIPTRATTRRTVRFDISTFVSAQESPPARVGFEGSCNADARWIFCSGNVRMKSTNVAGTKKLFMYQQNRTDRFSLFSRRKSHVQFCWYIKKTFVPATLVDFNRKLPEQQIHLALTLQPLNLRPADEAVVVVGAGEEVEDPFAVMCGRPSGGQVKLGLGNSRGQLPVAATHKQPT